MTSTNINKIVRSNLQIKPWMLSKNSSEIIDDYIKNMYKQMPNKFKHALKKVKIASPREENMGPIKQFLSQNIPVTPKIVLATLRTTDTEKGGSSKPRNPILKALTPHIDLSEKSEGTTTPQLKKPTAAAVAANLGSRKKLLSPIYKVNSSRRFGSSASSSRSSLYRRRHDDRRTHHYRTNILNNLASRQYNSSPITTSGMDRYLNPSRNQKLQSTLGSIPDAMQVSSAIVNELMSLDDVTLKRLSVHEEKAKAAKKAALKKENLDKAYKPSPLEPTLKKSKEVTNVWPRDSFENKAARKQTNIINFLRHSKPPAELFTLQHDRYKTELHEKHRRNRMKKLGLIERSPSPPPAHKRGPKTEEKSDVETHGEPFNQAVMNNIPQKKPQQLKQVSETIKITNHQPSSIPLEANVIKRKWQQSTTDLINSNALDEPVVSKLKIVRPSKQQLNVAQDQFSTINANAATKNQSIIQKAMEQNNVNTNASENTNSENFGNAHIADSPTASLTANLNATPLAKNYTAYRYNHSHYISK